LRKAGGLIVNRPDVEFYVYGRGGRRLSAADPLRSGALSVLEAQSI